MDIIAVAPGVGVWDSGIFQSVTMPVMVGILDLIDEKWSASANGVDD